MNQSHRRPRRAFQPRAELCESRQLLTTVPVVPLAQHPLYLKGSDHPVRPNTPVLPYAADFSIATFIDPTVHISAGNQITLNQQDYVAPYANLDASGGYIKIGRYDSILDNASLVAGAGAAAGTLGGQNIGDLVVIAQGARVLGSSTIGAFGADLRQPTYVGPNATINNATVAPGGYVSDMAYVGPGVIIPSGYAVKPAGVVLSQAEATNPALGQVQKITAAQRITLDNALLAGPNLARGYTTVYQGNKLTGLSPGTTTSGIYNGDLSLVLGAGPDAGKAFVLFESNAVLPRFLGPHGGFVFATLPNLRLRIIGDAIFSQKANQVNAHSGRGDSIRADVGQPITIGSIGSLGNNVSIHALQGGKLTIGQNLVAQDRAVILGGKNSVLGDNVLVGAGAVLDNASVGSGAVIGANALLLNVTIPAGAVVPPGTILVKP